jgi:hypothetical protein
MMKLVSALATGILLGVADERRGLYRLKKMTRTAARTAQ